MRKIKAFYNKGRKFISLQITRNKAWETAEHIFRLFENILWRISGKVIIECFGDSHLSVFGYLNKYSTLKDFRFRCIPVPGATAFGLANPNSKTNAFKIFSKWFDKIHPKAPILFMMGEVDTGFLIWYRAQKYNQDPYAIFDEAVNNYTNFLQSVKCSRTTPIIVCSAPLPTIQDGVDMGEVANLRKDIKATQKERTDMTLKFNSSIQTWCRNNGIIFLDLDVSSLDVNTGLVKSILLNKNPHDHHYNADIFCDILNKEIINQNILAECQVQRNVKQYSKNTY